MMAGDLPSKIPDREIDFLRSLEDAAGIVVFPPPFGVGDRVRIVGGRQFLRDRVGVVQALAAGKCRVLLSLCGGDAVEKMPAVLLEKA
jgi:hypothetical protein